MAGTAPRKRRDAKSVLAGAQRAQRSVPLCLRGDLVAQMQELNRDLEVAEEEQKRSGSLDGGRAPEIAAQIKALAEEMRDDTIVVWLKALPRRKSSAGPSWTSLIAAHPPREDNDTDRLMGVNQETFFDALLRACVVDPVLDEDDWARLDEVLSDGQWQALNNAAWLVNTESVDVPFSRRASRILANSVPASEQPAPGE